LEIEKILQEHDSYYYDYSMLSKKLVYFTNKLSEAIQRDIKGQEPIQPPNPPFYKRKRKLSQDNFLPFPEIRL
jgi:hypothetical protein